jgi:hypothetical protein
MTPLRVDAPENAVCARAEEQGASLVLSGGATKALPSTAEVPSPNYFRADARRTLAREIAAAGVAASPFLPVARPGDGACQARCRQRGQRAQSVTSARKSGRKPARPKAWPSGWYHGESNGARFAVSLPLVPCTLRFFARPNHRRIYSKATMWLDCHSFQLSCLRPLCRAPKAS